MLHFKQYIPQNDHSIEVVFLHGFLEDLSMWDSIISNFNHVRLILIDLPGHGESSNYDLDHYSMDFMAEKVKDVFDQEGIENPIVIGHSLGGYVGLELMNIFNLKKLVLFNSNFWADSEERKNNRNRVIEVVKKNKSVFLIEAIRNLFYLRSEELNQEIELLINKASKMPVEEIIKSTIGLRDRIYQGQVIEKNAEDIHVVHAENDPIIPNEEMEYQLGLLQKKPEFHLIQNSGHMSVWENPKATNRILRNIIES